MGIKALGILVLWLGLALQFLGVGAEIQLGPLLAIAGLAVFAAGYLRPRE